MSYGWLTESSLIPTPAVPINVDNSSVLLKSTIDSCYEDRINERQTKSN